jgi:hypothetical protein
MMSAIEREIVRKQRHKRDGNAQANNARATGIAPFVWLFECRDCEGEK